MTDTIFLSYMREDGTVVDRLAAELAKQGATVWRDREAIQPGVPWRDAIRTAIRDGTYFLACFSRHYSSRPDTYMNEELLLACAAAPQRSGTWLIPVNLDGCVIPTFSDDRRIINDVQHVFVHPNWEDGLTRLVEATVQPTKTRRMETIEREAVELIELEVRLSRAEKELEREKLHQFEEGLANSRRPAGTGVPVRISDLSGYNERVAAANARVAEKRAVYTAAVGGFLQRYDEEYDPFVKMRGELDARQMAIDEAMEREDAQNKSFARGVMFIIAVLIALATILAIVLGGG